MNFSVIIPTLNEQNDLPKLLGFLVGVLDNSDEIIVVDGNSTDNTVQIAMSFGVKVFKTEQSSRASQMNLGARKATGNIYYFVHADAMPPKSFKKDIIKSIGEGFLVGCFRFKFDSTSYLLAINSYCTRFDKIMCRGGDQTLFITKDVFDKLNGYNEKFQIMEDYDLIIRSRKNEKFRIIPKNVIVSPRKYSVNSYLRVNIANLAVFLLFAIGTSQERMIRTYNKMIRRIKN
jgi:rSAM/selenodomain-associated transferase 2